LLLIPLLATFVGVAGAALGIWLTGLRRHVRLVAPFSALVLVGVALFGLLPELVQEAGWLTSGALFLAGYGLMLLVGRFIGRHHDSGASDLPDFAGPLVAAAALHSFLDGWSVAAVQSAATLGLRVAVPLAVTLHKLPEGVALGGILRVSVERRGTAMGWCVLAEGATLAGGALALWMAPHLGTRWTTYPLGLTAGWLFYLGYHAVHEAWKQREFRRQAP
jgi:zinc transporter ZupT